MKKEIRSITPVLLGGDLNAYSVALAFREAYGVRSHAFMSKKCGATEKSHFIRQHIISGIDDVRVAVPELLRFAAENIGTELFLIPCSDEAVTLSLDMRSVLRGTFNMILPDKTVYRSVSDGCSFYSLLHRYGLPCPEYVFFECGKSPSDKKLSAVGFPAVITPSDGLEHSFAARGEKREAYLVRDPRDARDAIKRIFDSGYKKRIILRRRVEDDGQCSTLTTFSDTSGQVVRAVLGRVVLERSFGSYSAIITKPLNALSFKIIRFLNSIGYVGFANFKIYGEGDGALVLEMNARQGKSCDHLRCAGVNIAKLIVRATSGEELIPLFEYNEVYWHYPSHGAVLKYSGGNYISDAVRLHKDGKGYAPFFNKYEGAARRLYASIDNIRLRRALRRGMQG